MLPSQMSGASMSSLLLSWLWILPTPQSCRFFGVPPEFEGAEEPVCTAGSAARPPVSTRGQGPPAAAAALLTREKRIRASERIFILLN